MSSQLTPQEIGKAFDQDAKNPKRIRTLTQKEIDERIALMIQLLEEARE